MAGGPAQDGTDTAPWALALRGEARAEEGWGVGGLFKPPGEAPGPRLKSGGEGQPPAPSETAGDMGDGEGLVGRHPGGRGREGGPPVAF